MFYTGQYSTVQYSTVQYSTCDSLTMVLIMIKGGVSQPGVAPGPPEGDGWRQKSFKVLLATVSTYRGLAPSQSHQALSYRLV